MTRETKLETSTQRYEMIAPLLSDGLCAAEKRRLKAQIMEKENISDRTLRRYIEKYRKNKLQGLEPAGRPEAGTSKAIPETVLEQAIALKEELPERSVRSIIRILEGENVISPDSISRSTLSHTLSARGYSAKQLRGAGNSKPARRFVRKGRNTLWQGDVKYGPYIKDKQGVSHRTYLAAFIDDATRLITHSEFYFNHRVPIIEDCLRKAITKFGKPDSVYVDNGREYASTWMRVGCARLGINLTRTAPYSPESKGKIEKFNGYVDQFMGEASLLEFKSLSELNQKYRAWLEEAYQHKEHSSLKGETPMHSWQSDPKRITFVSVDALYDAFLHEETRVVDKTGCFSLQGVTFDAGVKYCRKKIDVRFDPFDISTVELWYSGEKVGIIKPLVPREFVGKSPAPEKAKTEIGRSRLLDIYQQEHEKRRNTAIGILSFKEANPK
jgi:transposase InsO family protein